MDEMTFAARPRSWSFLGCAWLDDVLTAEVDFADAVGDEQGIADAWAVCREADKRSEAGAVQAAAVRCMCLPDDLLDQTPVGRRLHRATARPEIRASQSSKDSRSAGPNPSPGIVS